MSATLAPTAAPPNAIRVWADSRYLYAELPGKPDSPIPCILSFSRSSRGFADLLNILYGHTDTSGEPQNYLRKKKELVGTAAQHALVEGFLRRNGVIK